MSNMTKTVSYLKRNGWKHTINAVMERIDQKHRDAMQIQAAAWQGCRDWSEASVAAGAATRAAKISFSKNIRFSILVPAYETAEEHLREMIDSVLNQTYSNLELILADASASDRVQRVVAEYEQDERLKYLQVRENKGISANTNAALWAATGDYIGLLDHDDLLTLDALEQVMKQLEQREYLMLYSNEDKCDQNGEHFFEPHFKPDFDLDLLLSNNYICHFLVMKSDLMKKLEFRPQFDGAQDYDLILRAAASILDYDTRNLLTDRKQDIAHIDRVLYHWRCHQASTASNPESKRYAYEAGRDALEDFLHVMNIHSKVSHSRHLGFYRVEYQDSLMAQRPEVRAVCGRVIKKGVVTGGPKIKKQPIFNNLRKTYSGYMHRAALYLEVEEWDDRAVELRKDVNPEVLEKGIVVYDPKFVKHIN